VIILHGILASIFWSSLGLILYHYIGYPLLVYWAARIWPRRVPQSIESGQYQPLVTVVIAAHNEERWIERKIHNTLALAYPPDRLQILVASDGSTDNTVEMVLPFSSRGVEVVHYPERAGKLATLNRVVLRARGDVLLFTDAKAMLEPDALRWVIPHFENPQVGGVAGNRGCLKTDSPATEGEGLYWRYEAWIRHSESRLYSCLGAYGQIYAVRRSVFPFVQGFSDDTIIPLKIPICSDSVIVFEPRILARIPAAATLRQEWERKVRSHLALFYDLRHVKQGLNPATSRIWWPFWSHHIFRLFIAWAMLAALLVLPWLFDSGMMYRCLFYAQILIYAAAILGLLLARRGIRWNPAYTCFYFVFANLAVGFAWVRWLQGKKEHSWPQVERILPAIPSVEDMKN
jgi:biofilm PGA synthesis N-glycosyltransferase PgaC